MNFKEDCKTCGIPIYQHEKDGSCPRIETDIGYRIMNCGCHVEGKEFSGDVIAYKVAIRCLRHDKAGFVMRGEL